MQERVKRLKNKNVNVVGKRDRNARVENQEPDSGSRVDELLLASGVLRV